MCHFSGLVAREVSRSISAASTRARRCRSRGPQAPLPLRQGQVLRPRGPRWEPSDLLRPPWSATPGPVNHSRRKPTLSPSLRVQHAKGGPRNPPRGPAGGDLAHLKARPPADHPKRTALFATNSAVPASGYCESQVALNIPSRWLAARSATTRSTERALFSNNVKKSTKRAPSGPALKS